VSAPRQVRPGQQYADNDPRCQGRVLIGHHVENGIASCYVWYEDSIKTGRNTTISCSRLLMDNRRGFRLVKEAPDA
jgi:hypothetical protein